MFATLAKMSDQAWHTVVEALKALTYDKFSTDFHVYESFYRCANGQDDIRVHILVPRDLSPAQAARPRPVLVRIHGGYLVSSKAYTRLSLG